MRVSTPGQRLCSAVEGCVLVAGVELEGVLYNTGGFATSMSAACRRSLCRVATAMSCVTPICGFQVHRLPDQARAGMATAVSELGESGLIIGRSYEKNASV